MSKTVTRFVNSFLSQATRRGLRAAGVPRHFVPFAVGMVRDFNRKMQWGNRAVWSKRVENGKAMYSEFTQWQKEISPVYRFRGGSATVRPHLSQETVRDKFRNPNLVTRRRFAGGRIDSSTLIVGGIGFVVIASMAGPWLAKRVNYVDPLDLREASISSGSNFDLKF